MLCALISRMAQDPESRGSLNEWPGRRRSARDVPESDHITERPDEHAGGQDAVECYEDPVSHRICGARVSKFFVNAKRADPALATPNVHQDLIREKDTTSENQPVTFSPSQRLHASGP